jgi:hypothetical protein
MPTSSACHEGAAFFRSTSVILEVTNRLPSQPLVRVEVGDGQSPVLEWNMLHPSPRIEVVGPVFGTPVYFHSEYNLRPLRRS